MARKSPGEGSSRSWQQVLTLEGQGSMFRFTEFSPDGNAIGTWNSTRIVHIWRAPSWAEINAQDKTPASSP